MAKVLKVVKCSEPFLKRQMRAGLRPDSYTTFTSIGYHSTVIYHLGEWAYPREPGTGLLCFSNMDEVDGFVRMGDFDDYYLLECEVADPPMQLPKFRLDLFGGVQLPSVRDFWTLPWREDEYRWLPPWPVGTVAYPRVRPLQVVAW